MSPMALQFLILPSQLWDNHVRGFPAILLIHGLYMIFNNPYVLSLDYDEPGGSGILVAPDIAVVPLCDLVQGPTMPYPGPPPGDIDGNPHARVICEVALHQDTQDWELKCQNWLRQQYVRYVFGIKIHGMRDAQNAQGQNHRSMTAKLWRQGAPPPGYIEWDFGTVQRHSQTLTNCNAAGLPAFQVQIPTSEIFWDPPILAGVPIVLGYNAVAPPALTIANVNIDLYRIQQLVLRSQLNH
ncbi:hypothetical protein BC936DRAFT_142937 [Jimgerdemannia flammicorona]|uniref:Uncharacterized protein n=1 Tax=Jimgerdemannia flammicorona TaxID=994334 RepID=A0A433DEK9_9FUNG|nr:hypothetical protein BC936DRAFT_142937 [Jimgerdemannia flammicorona]